MERKRNAGFRGTDASYFAFASYGLLVPVINCNRVPSFSKGGVHSLDLCIKMRAGVWEQAEFCKAMSLLLRVTDAEIDKTITVFKLPSPSRK